MCECKTKALYPHEFMSEYCTSCGKIWVLELCGISRPTKRYHKTAKPMVGIWVGHTFVQGPKPFLRSLSNVHGAL